MPVYSPVLNEQDTIRRAVLDIQNRDQAPGVGMDTQELRERREAFDAYLGEDEQHYVDFVEEMVRTTADTKREVRRIQQECWRVYQEDPPPNYALKEDWQAKTIVPKPYGAVQFAMAAVKQAFTPNFLKAESRKSPKLADFWTRFFNIQ